MRIDHEDKSCRKIGKIVGVDCRRELATRTGCGRNIDRNVNLVREIQQP